MCARRILWFFFLLLVSALTRVGAQSPDTEVLPLVISQPSGSVTFSTTVSGVNTSNATATIRIEVFDSSGSLIGQQQLEIPAQSMKSIRLLPDRNVTQLGWAQITVVGDVVSKPKLFATIEQVFVPPDISFPKPITTNKLFFSLPLPGDSKLVLPSDDRTLDPGLGDVITGIAIVNSSTLTTKGTLTFTDIDGNRTPPIEVVLGPRAQLVKLSRELVQPTQKQGFISFSFDQKVSVVGVELRTVNGRMTLIVPSPAS